MADLHIDDFCRDTARILLRLYGQFPRPQLLFVEEICGAAEPDEFGLPPERHQACFSALLWLGQEGWLRHGDSLRQEGVDQAVLTERGFRLLCSRAPGSDPAASLSGAATLRQALASGSSTLLTRTVQQLLGATP